MDIEYTGRHDAVITDEMRALAEPMLDRVEKMVGRGANAHVIVATEKNRLFAEVIVKTKTHDLVGASESKESLETALRQALEKTEAQASKFSAKRLTEHRRPKDEKTVVEPALERGGKLKRTGLLATVDSPLDEVLGLQPDIAPGPNGAQFKEQDAAPEPETEPHLTRSIDAIALGPMSLEEAIKEMETRNRDIFVFRDHNSSLLRILHCKRDGALELIELP